MGVAAEHEDFERAAKIAEAREAIDAFNAEQNAKILPEE
jgi:hypothetical protein